MADKALEAELIGLIAKERGVRPDKIALSSRLLQDLGMDGDDAVEFFSDFEKRYETDLSGLYAHWDRHFGPEGFGGPTTFLVMLALLILPFLALPFGISPLWILAVEFVTVLLWMWPLRQWLIADETMPVTVEHLLTAARIKRWPIAYE